MKVVGRRVQTVTNMIGEMMALYTLRTDYFPGMESEEVKGILLEDLKCNLFEANS